MGIESIFLLPLTTTTTTMNTHYASGFFSDFQVQSESVQVSPVQFSHSVMSDSATPWTAARQTSWSITNCQSLLKHMSIESVMPSNHLILCCSLLLLSSIFPSIGVFANESVLHSSCQSIGASAKASVLPVNFQGWFLLELTSLISLQSKGLSRLFYNTTVQKHQFFSAQPSLWFNSHIHTWPLEKP